MLPVTSNLQTVTCGVPQGFVLAPLLFTLYTSPLDKLAFSFYVNHHLIHLYTQLFTQFSSRSLQDAINQIHNALLNKYLSLDDLQPAMPKVALNHSKTEFLIIELREQLG